MAFPLTSRPGLPRGLPARSDDPAPRLWLHLGGADAIAPARLLLGRLMQESWPAPLRLFLSAPGGGSGWLRGLAADLPEDLRLAASALLDSGRAAMTRDSLRRWHPDLGVMVGALPDLTLAQLGRDAGAEMLAVDACFAPRRRQWPWQRGAQLQGLRAFRHILLRDQASAAHLRREDLPEGLLRVIGPLSAPRDPVPGDATELAAMGGFLKGRPVWLACDVTAPELPAVLAAHRQALRHTHRLLLILQTGAAVAGAARQALRAGGWSVAEREADEDPGEDIQVLLAQGEDELGLWYRLAPLCFMGGSFAPPASGRSPFEPAALGAALLHGPEIHAGPAEADYRALRSVGASRQVAHPDQLGGAVTELLAPDHAAQLACAAWRVTTHGAEVLEDTAHSLIDPLHEALARRTPIEETRP